MRLLLLHIKSPLNIQDRRKTKNGRTRYAFRALSQRDDTLRELNLYKRSLPEIKFGSGKCNWHILIIIRGGKCFKKSPNTKMI